MPVLTELWCVRGLCSDGPFICMQSFPGLGIFQIHLIQGKSVVTEPQENNTQGSDDEKRSSFGTHLKLQSPAHCYFCSTIWGQLKGKLRTQPSWVLGGWQGPGWGQTIRAKSSDYQNETGHSCREQWNYFHKMCYFLSSLLSKYEMQSLMGTKESHRHLYSSDCETHKFRMGSVEGILRQNWNTIFLDILTKFFM